MLILLSCKHETGFINYEKWQIPGAKENGFLRGRPKKIKETYYNLNDTTFHGEDKKEEESIYMFDSDGNITYSVTSIDTLLRREFFYSFNVEGFQCKSCSYSHQKKDSCLSETIWKSKRIGPNSFMTSLFRKGQKEYDELHIFEPDKVRMQRTTKNGEKTSIVFWYRSGKLVKTEIDSNPPIVSIYYRNETGCLDSIRSNNEKEFFINNDYGDPTSYYKISGKDTSIYERNKYEYDPKGNWVRKLSYRKDKDVKVFWTDKFPEFNLTVREINY